MPKSPVVVVPVERSPDMEPTTQAAMAIAKRHGAAVHLLEVVPPRGPSHFERAGDKPFRGGVRSAHDRSRLTQSLEVKGRAPVRVRHVAYRGDGAGIIPSYAQLVKAHLVVIGQHYGTPRWRRSTRLVSTLSRAAPCPVLVLPPGLPPNTTARAFTHIVSAVDFTVASAVAVRTTLDLIRRTGARLTVVHALTGASLRTPFSGGEALRVTSHLRRQADQVAAHLRSRIPAEVRIRVEARVTTGVPHRSILGIASEVAADLIVMGVPPRSRFDELLFGSTLRSVLRRTRIPVLVVPVPAGAYKWLREADGSRS